MKNTFATAIVVTALAATGAAAQERPTTKAPQSTPSSAVAAGVTLPPGYVIGPEDHLSIVFWNDKDMSTDIVVRPDGKISLPLLNEIAASGRTPEELRQAISSEAKRFIQEPNPTVIVRQINSRKVFITGAVEKPNIYPLNGPTTVLQLIATAGGVKEFANSSKIVIIRSENGKQLSFKFNYQEVVAQKNVNQNIELRPGDTVVVPQ